MPFLLPCGGCIGCRLAKARDWATRMKHEAQLHDDNCFITLTYEDAQLPEDGSISKRALQLFFKRLRKETDVRLRYFACGEYGDANLRPHYHAIIFGYGFPDKVFWRNSPRGFPLYRSPLLERVWTFGHSEIGAVSHQSAGYVARYALKKVGGDPAARHYERPHPETGEIFQVAPEFALMSRKPGIGTGWFDQFRMDCFPSDYVVIDGRKQPVPKFYKRKLTELQQLALKPKRLAVARLDAANRTPERLATREELQHHRQAVLKRDKTT